MERGRTYLNPNAAPFILFHKREANDKNKISEFAEGSSTGTNETVRSFSLTEGHHRTEKYFEAHVSDSDIDGRGGYINDSEVMRKGYKNISDQMGEKCLDEDSQMDIAYLAHMFPDISEQFLVDVYSVNGGDMEDSVDMLKQLACFPSALPKCLPDSLDCSDDSVYKANAEGSSLKPNSSDSSEVGASFQ